MQLCYTEYLLGIAPLSQVVLEIWILLGLVQYEILVGATWTLLREPKLSIQKQGQSDLQIFQKIFRNPREHRTKYFMAQ